MKVLKLLAKLINIHDEFGNYFFEVQCGNGPMVFAPSDAKEIIVPFVSSSATAAHLTVNIIGKVGSVKKLFGSKVAKIKCTNHRETVDMLFAKDTGDQMDAMVKVTYELLPCPMFDAMSHLNHGQGLCVAVTFVDAMKEDLSVRVLNEQGSCLSMGTIDIRTMSVFMILHHEHKKMEVSIAGKNSGVITIPIEDNVPLVTKFDTFPSGYVLISMQLTPPSSGRVLCLDDVLFDAPAHEQYVYHLENIRLGVDDSSSGNVSANSNGVLYGPILSRTEVPQVPTRQTGRVMYVLPRPRRKPESIGVEMGLHEKDDEPLSLTYDNGIGGFIFSDDSLDTSVHTRLSIIRIITTDVDDESVREGPCGIVLVSAILKEVDREECPGNVQDSSLSPTPTNAVERSSEGKDDKEAWTHRDSSRRARVSIAGEIDYVADLPDLPFLIGDRLAASVFIGVIEPPPVVNDLEENDTDLLQAESSLEALKNPTPRVAMEPVSMLPAPTLLSENPTSPQSRGKADGSALSVSVGAGGSIVQLLSDELKEKQRVINRLMDDNSAKAEVGSHECYY